MDKWLEITVFTSQEQLDNVAAMFNEFGSGGVVIEDPAFILEQAALGDQETIAPALAPTVAEPAVKAYFPCDDVLEARLEAITRRLDELSLRRQMAAVSEANWATAWQAYYKPVRVGRRLVVKPSWEEYQAAPEELVIEMDPGMAFGCGTHATTAMCMALLEEYLQGGETVCDVGAGSGILAVTAALLGSARVTAVDIDRVAVRVAEENVLRNGVSGIVTVLAGDLLDRLAGVKADVLVANIIADAIISLAPDVSAVLRPGGLFIASGIIRDRAGEVRLALRTAGLVPVTEKTDQEWVALVFRAGCGVVAK
ncbi:MAG: 50S ribosomal protein L11 methyltransferase [Firmicutes bacterium]|nr:50S ribosomal protein L11 methyltransferase [Bacillota bacterium]